MDPPRKLKRVSSAPDLQPELHDKLVFNPPPAILRMPIEPQHIHELSPIATPRVSFKKKINDEPQLPIPPNSKKPSIHINPYHEKIIPPIINPNVLSRAPSSPVNTFKSLRKNSTKKIGKGKRKGRKNKTNKKKNKKNKHKK